MAEQIVPHTHLGSPVLRPAESASRTACISANAQAEVLKYNIRDSNHLVVCTITLAWCNQHYTSLLTQWLSLLFEHAASTRCGFAWLSTSTLSCGTLLHCQHTVLTLCETTLICQTRIAEVETRFDPQKHGQRNRRHRGFEIAGVVADCRHGDNHRFASHSSHCMRRPITRGAQLLYSAVERQLRKSLEQQLGVDLSGHKALIRAEVRQ